MTGIGGYDLSSTSDCAFAFDYNSSGKLDHVVLYRPGTGIIQIIQNKGGNFSPVVSSTTGLGGFTLNSGVDRAFAFDYDGYGFLDHIVFFRPGTGLIMIVRRFGNSFGVVYIKNDGIGGFNLNSTADHAFAFDYNSTGKLDHIVFYRPGTGAIFILEHDTVVSFKAVYAQGDPGGGIGGYNLNEPSDRGFAFDYNGTGHQDHLVFYRPGLGAIFILERAGTGFNAVYAQGAPGNGIGGFNLGSNCDSGFPFDYTGNGHLDHLLFYRSGRGAAFVLTHTGSNFTAIYSQGDPGSGIGGYDFSSAGGFDLGFAFDFDGSGHPDHLFLYRPGTGIVWIIKNTAGTFTSVYSAEPPDALVNEVASGIRVYCEGGFAYENMRIGFVGTHPLLGPCYLFTSGACIISLAGTSTTVATAQPPLSLSHDSVLYNGSTLNSQCGAEDACDQEVPNALQNAQMWPVVDIVDGAQNHQAGHNVMFDPNSQNIAVYNIVGGTFTPGFSYQGMSTDPCGDH